jgi:hypothetical protein
MADGGVRGTDPITSHIAAKRVDVPKLQALYISTLKRMGIPQSTTEIANLCELGRDTMSPRSTDLEKKGWIKRCGYRHCKNNNGNASWMIAYGLPEWPVPEGGWPTKPPKKPRSAKAKVPVEPVAEVVVVAKKPATRRRSINDPRQGALL